MRVETKKQRGAAKENIKKAQQAWKDMSSEERAKAQPEGKERADVGRRERVITIESWCEMKTSLWTFVIMM